MGEGGSIPIVWNPASGGRAARVRRRLESALRGHGVRVVLREVAPAGVAGAVRALAEAGAPLVGVAGGDGTVRSAAEVLAGGATTLAVLPTGTVNSFARRLGIPDLDAAARTIARGAPLDVPLGFADEFVFLNTATFGQYAAVVRRRERMRRWVGKWPAAALAFLWAVRRLRTFTLSVDLPAGVLERVTPVLWVGVGRASFPRASSGGDGRDAEQLEVVIAEIGTRRQAVGFLGRVFVRALRDRPATGDAAVEVLHTRHLVLRGTAPIEATLDGEVFRLAAPISVSLQPAALRVLAPPRAD